MFFLFRFNLHIWKYITIVLSVLFYSLRGKYHISALPPNAVYYIITLGSYYFDPVATINFRFGLPPLLSRDFVLKDGKSWWDISRAAVLRQCWAHRSQSFLCVSTLKRMFASKSLDTETPAAATGLFPPKRRFNTEQQLVIGCSRSCFC